MAVFAALQAAFLIESQKAAPLLVEQEGGEQDSSKVSGRHGQPYAAKANEFWQQQQENDNPGKVAGEGGDSRGLAVGYRGEETGGKEVKARQQEAEAKEQETIYGNAVG